MAPTLRWRWLVVAAVLTSGGLASCADDDSSDDAAAVTTTSTTTTTSVVADTTTTTATEPFAAGDVYVAVGSSIASGFGIPVQSTDCGRSSVSYPQLVAAHYGLALVDVTCGGARVPNVVDTAQGEHPPQLTALTPDAALVTVTIGGNDIGYNGLALACGDPVSECEPPADLDANVDATGEALADMLVAIRTAAPDAVIVLVTYPREVPADANCPELSFSDTEYETIRSVGDALQQMFVEVVPSSPADVLVVDPYVEPGDHTGCAPAAERWVSGFDAPDSFSYHPTALGHEVMTEMVIDALDG